MDDVEAVVLELLEKPGQGGRRRRMLSVAAVTAIMLIESLVLLILY